MKYIIEKEKKLPVIATPDVLVVGAGPAGVVTAIAAARKGAHTMLIEQYGFVGGNLTAAEINPMFTFHDIEGRQIINGVAGEFVRRMVDQGFSTGHTTDLTFDNASMTPLDPTGSKIVLMQMLAEAGTEVLLQTAFSDVINDADGGIEAVIIENKGGRQAICPRVVVDCTGDGDVAARAGARFTIGDGTEGKPGVMQPVSLFFRVGGVNTDVLRKWMKDNRQYLKDAPTDAEIDEQKAIAFLGLNELVKGEIARCDLDEEIANRILMYELPHQQFAINATRLQNVSGLNAQQMTAAEARLNLQVVQLYHFLKKYVGGFAESYIIDTGVQVGVRETRHIVGEYVLNENDVLEGHAFTDGISCGTYAIDIHPGKGKMQIYTGSGKKVYEVPLRSLIPLGLRNILLAGRCISANHLAAGSIRVMATCMAMGQGAGTAAAMAAKGDSNPRHVDIAALRLALLQDHQILLDDRAERIIEPSLKLNRTKSDGREGSHYNPFIKK